MVAMRQSFPLRKGFTLVELPEVCNVTRKRLAAFTIVELLAVIAIIGLLVSLLLPAVQAAREAARRSQCQNNLRQLGLGLAGHHYVHGSLPIGCLDRRTPFKNPSGRQLSWSAALLPYLEQVTLWEQLDWDSAYDSGANAHAGSTRISILLCPSTTRLAAEREGAFMSPRPDRLPPLAAIDYGGNYGAAFVSPSANGVLLYDRAVAMKEISDGASYTLAVVEDAGRGRTMDGEWVNGENIFDVSGPINRQQNNEIWSDHAGGAQATRCDCSVVFLDETIDMAVLRALCTRHGDESHVTALNY